MSTTTEAAVPMHRRGRRPNYDRYPTVDVPGAGPCHVGPRAVAEAIVALVRERDARVVALEAYPGVLSSDLAPILAALRERLGATVVDASWAHRPPAAIDAMVADEVTDDPIFGRLTERTLAEWFDRDRLEGLRRRVRQSAGPVVVVGTGAALVADPDVLVLANLPRWEIQQRQRAGLVGNLGADNAGERASLLYKRAYFVDWRVADRHKRAVAEDVDLLLDTTQQGRPLAIAGEDWRRGLAEAVRRPFRVKPFFDPGPWGGQWMREVCDLPDGPPNYAWCFDCVPEENSLLLGVDGERVEVPSIDLVFAHPEELLGREVRARFGDEFPIRFDFLDTMGGGNLSLQVHPLTRYIREHFGVHYTQDESYYLLDVEGDATVYLGLREGIDRDAMAADLRRAQEDPDAPFPAERYVNRFPAARHDHFLIPAGTVHCSGAGAMVLEISATPYIFTFKLWDWGRLGLDGRPRPINIDRGIDNVQWHRDTTYARERLVNVVTPLGAGDGWRAERTGLHEAEFIETHRHWFSGTVTHDTRGPDGTAGVNVCNLVQGEEAVVESPTGAFAPFVVHYAETFIVPAAVGAYTIRPHGPAVGTECATIKAFVR